MTLAILAGPAITLVIWFGWLASLAFTLRQKQRGALGSRCSVSLIEIPTAALVIATLQLLLNLALQHFGDATVIAVHVTFVVLAMTAPGPQLPMARIYRERRHLDHTTGNGARR